jgi:hypothetical protein
MENILIDPKRHTMNEFKSKNAEDKINKKNRNIKSKT